MNIDKNFLEQEGLGSEIISRVVKDFQKAGEKYNGIQCAIAMEILLRTLCPKIKQRAMVKEIVDNFFDIEVGN